GRGIRSITALFENLAKENEEEKQLQEERARRHTKEEQEIEEGRRMAERDIGTFQAQVLQRTQAVENNAKDLKKAIKSIK
ncbi:src substrate cortactin isoform X1, partial [Clarias magur]